MEPLLVTHAEDLHRVPVHDAWFDPGEIVHDPVSRTLLLPFAQEPFPDDDVPEPQRVGARRLSKEYRVAFLDWRLLVHGVRRVDAEEGWADMGMLLELDYDEARQALSITAGGDMTVMVDALRVDAGLSADRIRWMRRTVGLFGFRSHAPW